MMKKQKAEEMYIEGIIMGKKNRMSLLICKEY
jgi:hypothetical protein